MTCQFSDFLRDRQTLFTIQDLTQSLHCHFGIRYGNKRIRYVIQKDQKCLVHAIRCAEDVFSGENFFLALGEEGLTYNRCGDIILNFKNNMRSFKKVHFVQFEEGEIFNYMNTLSMFRINPPKLGGGLKFERYADHQERCEKELRNLVQCGIDDGKIVLAFLVRDQYFNINSIENLMTAESLVKE